MDQEFCIFKEHERIVGLNGQDRVFKIEFREYKNPDDIVEVTGLIYSYYKMITDEDTSNVIEVDTKEGKTNIIAAEAELYRFLYEGAKIQLVCLSGLPVGFMIYHDIFPTVIAVRAMYADPDLHCRGIGRDLLNSIGRVKKVLFQTHRNRPPSTLLTSTCNKKIIDKGDKFITWEMNWEQE